MLNENDIKDTLAATKGGERVTKIGFDLGPLLTMVAAQGLMHEIDEPLEMYLNKGGTVQGRAGTKNGGAGGEPGEGLKFYTRPNGQKYYPRDWNEVEDVELIKQAREVGMAILAEGPPGTGKTAMFEAAFEDLITVVGTGDTTVMDLIGQFVPDPKGGYRWVDGPVLVAASEGRPILIDEIGLIDTKELAVLYSFMDGRGEYTVTANLDRGTVVAQPGFYVMAATNPKAPGVRLSEALTSRFPIRVEVRTDYRLARDLGVPEKIVRIATNLDGTDGASWAPQMRELLAYRDQKAIFGEKFALANLVASTPELDRKYMLEAIQSVMGQKVKSARLD
jgi:nitric oxide reductase NorQ protein